jgi:hypothetical protein
VKVRLELEPIELGTVIGAIEANYADIIDAMAEEASRNTITPEPTPEDLELACVLRDCAERVRAAEKAQAGVEYIFKVNLPEDLAS